jgi:hypothetical protein
MNDYKQLTNTYNASPYNPTTFSGSITFTITGTYFGAAGSTICTVSVPATPAAGAYGCSGYADYNTAVSLPIQSGSNPANVVWQYCSIGCTFTTRSFTDTTGGNSHSTSYIEDFSNTYTVAANAQTNFDTGMSWAITGTIGGATGQTVCTITSTAASSDSCSGGADTGTVTTIPQAASSPPANSRWQSTATCTATYSTGGNTLTCQSYKQWTNNWLYAVIDGGSPTAPILSCNVYGSVSTLTLTTTAQVFWCDNNVAASATNPTSNSGSTERWAYSTGFTVTSGGSTNTFNYYHQFNVTYEYTLLGGAGSSSAPTFSYTQYGSTATATASTTPNTAWADNTGTWSFTNPLTGSGSSERWDANSGTSGTISAASTFNPTYYHQFLQTLSYSVSGGGTPTTPTY